ncbi:MAG: TonB-dependent receptor [Candidatus Marinimicrobia bacterium]|nr:TonB-dependent receptor [Candidatus Neomarinimicrobiota bacterium]
MKRNWFLIIFSILIVNTVLLATPGTISGKIIDDDNFSLAGANVFIPVLGSGTATNHNGEFVLVNVPEGEYELKVTYMGYEQQALKVKVEGGKSSVLTIEMKPGVIVGNEVLVLGDRLKGQAKALQQQKTSGRISNVVSSDQIGRFPDANIGDALKRIPSIHVNYDQGEARFVNIRGTEARLNSVMINGDRVPSAEGEIRTVQVDLIPSDMIQTIEVSKAITADMDADAIGGAINLVTRQAPNGRRISGTLGSGYNFISAKPQMIGSGVLGQRFFKNKLGVVLSASYFDNPMGSHDAEGEWDFDDDGNVMLKEWQIRTYFVQRIRKSISGNFDFAINDNHKLMLNTMYNHRNDWENRYRVVYADLDEGDEAKIERQVKGGIDNDANHSARLEDQRITSLSLKGEHLLGNIKMDWSAGYAKASEERPNERYIQWVVEDVEFTQDFSKMREPKINAVDASAIAYENFELDELTEEYQYTDEQDLNARLNLVIPVIKEGQYNNNLKVGFKYKQKDKKRDNEFYEYSPLEEGDLEYMTNTKLKDITEENFLAGDYEAGEFTDAEYLGGLKLSDASRFEKEDKPDEYAADNYEATETVTAGYLLLDQNIGEKLSLNAGLRVEMTNIDYTGNEWIEEDEEGNENVIKSTNGTDDYMDILPSLHIRYEFDKNTILKAAWTNTIARPNYYDLVPYRAIEGYDEGNVFEEMAVGNPALEPTRSMNFDLMGEKYFSTIGILSAGVFYKAITDYIYVQELNDFEEDGRIYEDYFKPMNGGDATLYGFEFAYQQQLGFITPALKNVGVYFNYTYTYSEADNPAIDDILEDADEDKIGLPGTAPHALNTALTYQTKKFGTGLSFNFTDAYLDGDEMDLTPGLERYYDKVTYLDFNASYLINDHFRIFLEANNLLNQPLRYYAGDPERTYQGEYYNRRLSFGLKFDM